MGRGHINIYINTHCDYQTKSVQWADQVKKDQDFHLQPIDFLNPRQKPRIRATPNLLTDADVAPRFFSAAVGKGADRILLPMGRFCLLVELHREGLPCSLRSRLVFLDINPKVTLVYWLNQWVYLDPKTPLPLCCLFCKETSCPCFGATTVCAVHLSLVSIVQGNVFVHHIFL